jgi:hypothetical protein
MDTVLFAEVVQQLPWTLKASSPSILAQINFLAVSSSYRAPGQQLLQTNPVLRRCFIITYLALRHAIPTAPDAGTRTNTGVRPRGWFKTRGGVAG